MNWHDIFAQIANMSLTAGIIILFVLLFRRLFKNIPKVFSYVLWAVVLFRLISPVSFSSSISLLGVFDAPKVETTGIASSVEYVSPEIYVEYREIHTPTPSVRGSENTVVQAQPETKVSVDPIDIIICVWIVGILAMVGYSLVSYIKLKRKLMAVIHLRDNIYLADHIESAFVMGLVRPKIYLPSSLTETEQEYIIMHEQHHIRRCDHVMKFIGFAALCVHWFNPLVWVAFIQSGKDMEMSCDEAVIKKMGEGIRAEYSASLLSLSIGRHIIAGTPLAFSEGNVKRRIINMANWKRPKMWISILVAISCLLFTVAFAANPQTIETKNDTPAPNIENNIEKSGYGTGTLIDNVPKPERNVLFKTVETPYDFFSKVTLDDIDDYYMYASDWGDDLYTYDTENVDRLLGIIDGIKESEIQEIVPVPYLDLYNSDLDAFLDIQCDDVETELVYKNGEIYLSICASYNENGIELEKTNPDFYSGDYKWKVDNEALVELFEEYIEAFGGKDGPQLVDLTNKSFTVAGEDLVKYRYRTDHNMIILEIEDPSGEFRGLFSWSGGGGNDGSISHIENDEEGLEVYKWSVLSPESKYRISGEDLEDCTITLSSKDRF